MAGVLNENKRKDWRKERLTRLMKMISKYEDIQHSATEEEMQERGSEDIGMLLRNLDAFYKRFDRAIKVYLKMTRRR